MIHSGQVGHLVPIHYRYTSFLRDTDEAEATVRAKDTTPSAPLRTSSFRAVFDEVGGVGAAGSARNIERLEKQVNEDEPRSLNDRLFAEDDRYDEVAVATASQEQQPSDPEEEDNVGSPDSMAASAVPATRALQEGGFKQSNETNDDNVKAKQIVSSPKDMGTSYPRRQGSWDEVNDHPMDRTSHNDDNMTNADEQGRHDNGARLPGIAHLDRQMSAPWGAPRRGMSGDDHYAYGDREAMSSRWQSGYHRRAGEDDDFAAHRRLSSSNHGESFSEGPSPRLPYSQGPSDSHAMRRSLADRGSYPNHSASGYASGPYKRSRSPLSRDHDHEMMSQSSYRSEDHAHQYRRPMYAHGNGESTWPESPSTRARSPSGYSAINEKGAGHHAKGDAGSTPTMPVYRLSGSGVPGRTGTEAGAEYGYGSEERSPLPLHAHEDVRRSTSMQSRYDAVSAAGPLRSPPLRSIHDDRRRMHGGSGSSASSAGEPYTYASYRPSSGLPRPTSLRSHSIHYPYDEKVDGQAAHYDEGPHYMDDGPMYSSASRHESSNASSPRHHPYGSGSHHHSSSAGGPGQHGHPGSSYVDAVASANASTSGGGSGGSPNSMPRRRGKLPKPVTDLLKTWLLDHAAHPYPTEDEKRRLCAATGLSISQVSNWFINARRRILVPQGSGHFGVAPPSSSTVPVAGAKHGPSPHSPEPMHHHYSHGQHPSQHPSQHAYRQEHSHHHPYPQSQHRHSLPAPVHSSGPSSHVRGHPHHGAHNAPLPPLRHQGGGLPLGPPPLPLPPSLHHTRNAADQHPYEATAEGASMRSLASDSFSRSAERSPILTRRLNSPP